MLDAASSSLFGPQDSVPAPRVLVIAVNDVIVLIGLKKTPFVVAYSALELAILVLANALVASIMKDASKLETSYHSSTWMT